MDEDGEDNTPVDPDDDDHYRVLGIPQTASGQAAKQGVGRGM